MVSSNPALAQADREASKLYKLASLFGMTEQLQEHLLRGHDSKGSTDLILVLDLSRNVSVVEIAVAIPKIHSLWRSFGGEWSTLGCAS